jgi:opacity protein-like surface antigen
MIHGGAVRPALIHVGGTIQILKHFHFPACLTKMGLECIRDLSFPDRQGGGIMKLSKAFSIVLAVAFIALAVPASAAENPANYMVLKGGLYSPSQDFDIGATHFELDDGFVAEVAFGHYYLPVFATELGVGYFESKGSPATPSGETKFKVVPVTLTAKALLPFGPIEPYGEFGIGGYITKAEVSGTIANFSGSTKGVFGLHAGAGVNFNVAPNTFVGAEGKYI